MSDNHPTTYPRVTLRPFREDDLEFIYQVYASSRADEMVMIVDWSEAQKEGFLRWQFGAQHTYYQTNYPNARYDIIVMGAEPLVAAGTFRWLLVAASLVDR